MIIRAFRNTKRFFAVAALAACLGAFTTAFAELDGGIFQLFQNGVQVGLVYVPDRAPGTTLYAEDWILFSNYVYPGSANTVLTEIVPSARNPYTSETDFFRRAPWGTGFRYVHVAANDTTTLPGR